MNKSGLVGLVVLGALAGLVYGVQTRPLAAAGPSVTSCTGCPVVSAGAVSTNKLCIGGTAPANCTTTLPTGNVSGAGANTRLAFWTGASTLSSAAGLNWDGTKLQAPTLDLGANSGNGQLSFTFPYYLFGNGISVGNGVDPAIVVGGGKVCLEAACSNYIRYGTSGLNIVTAGGGVRSEQFTFTGDSTVQTTAYPGALRDTFGGSAPSGSSALDIGFATVVSPAAGHVTELNIIGLGLGTVGIGTTADVQLLDANTAAVLCTTPVNCTLGAGSRVFATCTGPGNSFPIGHVLVTSLSNNQCTSAPGMTVNTQLSYP